MKLLGRHKEASWLAPLALIAALLPIQLRPQPQFPPPLDVRVVADAEGASVAVPNSLRGVALTWGSWGGGAYLEMTHSPQSLRKAGAPIDRLNFEGSLMERIYPQIAGDETLWDGASAFSHGHDANSEIEALLAHDGADVYLGNGGNFGIVPNLRRAGLPAAMLSAGEKNWDKTIFAATRVANAVLGRSDFAETIISRYMAAFERLADDLRPSTLTSLPRALLITASTRDPTLLRVLTVRNSGQIYLPPAGLRNATEGFIDRAADAERILATDPDIIFTHKGREVARGQTVQEFKDDPRWRGLRAVQENRVYQMVGLCCAVMIGLDFNPIRTRWMAEIAHPDRLGQKVRHLLRDHFVDAYGYRLSDEQIDGYLKMQVNRETLGYERFAGGVFTDLEEDSR